MSTYTNTTFNKIGEHLDEKLKNSKRIIEGIKGQLFDALTLGDGDETTRKEICKKIIQELNEKKSDLERNNPEPRDKQIQRHIDNLNKLITDTKKRRNEKLKNELKPNKYISLDRDNKFDSEVINSIGDDIIKRGINNDSLPDDILIKRLLEIDKDGKYCTMLINYLNQKISAIADGKQKENLEKIILKLGKNEKNEDNKKDENENSYEYHERSQKAYEKTWNQLEPEEERKNRIIYHDDSIEKIKNELKIRKITKKDKKEITDDDINSNVCDCEDDKGNKYDIKVESSDESDDTTRCEYYIVSQNDIIEEREIIEDFDIYEPFEDSDKGVYFYKICKKYNIKREDGIEVPSRKGINKFVTYIYEDPKTGQIKKLKIVEETGANTDDKRGDSDDYSGSTRYKFVDADSIEDNKEDVNQNIIEKDIQEVTSKGSKVPSVLKTSKLSEQRERMATITSVNQVNRAIAQREADTELEERYSHMKWRNVFDRANLFLRRQFIKDRLVDKKLGGKKGFDWTESGQFAADRHQIEQQNQLAERMKIVIEDIDKDNYPVTREKLDKLLDDLTGNPNTVPPRQRSIDDRQFQTEFQSIIQQSGKNYDKEKPSTATSTNWRPISEIIKNNDMDQLSTNILMQANKFREHQFMVRDIANYIMLDSISDKTRIKQAYPNYNSDFDSRCRGRIQRYVNTYNDIPDFLHQMGVNLDNKEATKDIRTLQRHDGALSTISAQTLKLKIQMLNDGGEAYNVKKRDGFAKIGRWLDRPEYLNSKRWREHPNFKEFYGRFRGAVKLGVMATPGIVAGALGAGPLGIAGVVGGMSFLTTLFKKKSHYEKEQRSYQRMQATNLEDYRQKREDLANEVAGMKRYEGRFWGKKARARNQFRDYVSTTQDQLSLSTELTKNIEKRLQSTSPLEDKDKRYLVADIAEGLARLDYHKKTGQNFLGSNNPATAEKEYRELQNAVMGGARRLGAVDQTGNPDMEIIRNTDPYSAYYNSTISIIEDGQGDEYNTQGYLKARQKYKNRSNVKAGWGALKAGLISFGLSYLASSLASTKEKTITEDDLKEMTHGKEGGEFNLGDYQENLLVTGDVDPTMRAVINGNTQEISKATLFSSVDAAEISVEKGLQKLQSATDALNTALQDPIVAGNRDLVKAVQNYVKEAWGGIKDIPGLSQGNQHLNLARAMEDVRTGILEPVIASGNKTIQISPDCIHWIDGGAQATGSGAIGQSFRNMGILNIEYVQNVGKETLKKAVTRAIPIPVGLNTFGEPKSEVKSAA